MDVIDTSEVDALATEMVSAAANIDALVKPVVAKGALNIKKQLREEAGRSRHFRMAHTISYDLDAQPDGIEAEVGPEKGGAGSLAPIAYFGGVHGGGATVPDPQGALDAEAPRFESALEALADKL